MKRLFGTDGIRGIAGTAPLDPPGVRSFGVALADVLAAEAGHRARVVVGRDTRESGPWLMQAIADGLAARGAETIDAGVITTPGLAYVARSVPFDAGVMISASHNPYRDNGLKVFSRDGFKLPDAIEMKIEASVLDGGREAPPEGAGRPIPDGSLVRRYVASLEGVVPAGRFASLSIVLDCANGSATEIAPRVFRDLGARVTTRGDAPDGRNINLDCGSLHLDGLARVVREGGHDIGLAFDGDADRCLAVDRTGRVVDGDHILFVCGTRLKRERKLTGDAVVATIMSNFWLEKRFGELGIKLHRAQVGDKYVLEMMMAEGAALGGEQSGHVIFRDRGTTGDGILTGLLLLDAALDGAEPLETVLDGIVPYPQILINVPVASKPDLRAHPAIGPVVEAAERDVAGRGRIVLRYSGTENLARVMVEADDDALVRGTAERIAASIRDHLA
ncbi:MAG TPA: phosphoglucosamine mutase [Candidatus Polarisedimenticolaceae bacterium]|nr:phosphoglucosamine mutase [Candidatus Polarisedimenticolaceae bacterium]